MANSLRPVSTDVAPGLLADLPSGDDFGPAPQLNWIKIADLVIDDRYQRDVMRRGARNIARIAREFDWRKFAPVIVAPVAGGRFAIVDGQHRTTAALARGIEAVPCQIIMADQREQADAFAAINGVVTQMSPLQIHAAKVAAGDEEAIRLRDTLAAAGVTICRYPIQSRNIKVGQTMAVTEVAKLLRAHGAAILTLALRCITGTRDGNAGQIRAATVAALCNVLEAEPAWRREARLLAAMQAWDFEERYAAAQASARRRRIGVTAAMSGDLFDFLDQSFKG